MTAWLDDSTKADFDTFIAGLEPDFASQPLTRAYVKELQKLGKQYRLLRDAAERNPASVDQQSLVRAYQPIAQKKEELNEYVRDFIYTPESSPEPAPVNPQASTGMPAPPQPQAGAEQRARPAIPVFNPASQDWAAATGPGWPGGTSGAAQSSTPAGRAPDQPRSRGGRNR
ncbi:hypothetical protein [Micromonospora yangpuensis]|uniref:hypothetical protein n=1 Tax=Micromonospora yangpuensis TaxID=683228 RepID=UPI001112E221|nr:hypothetical protein [Micromonospora yangpuensis]